MLSVPFVLQNIYISIDLCKVTNSTSKDYGRNVGTSIVVIERETTEEELC